MLFALFAFALSAPLVKPHEEKSFLSWMRATNQLFVGDEYQIRFGIWLAKKEYVQSVNAGHKGFTVSLNKFAAHTPAEYQALLGLKLNLKKHTAKKTIVKDTVPVDWRTKGVVNAIQDQAQCGSCWAFSTVAAIESIYAIKYTTLYKLSEQNVVDCSTTNYGCSGGWMDWALDDIIQLQDGKLNLLKDYPYKAIDQTCKYDATSAVLVVASYIWVNQADEDDLAAKAAQYGPVSVAIDASNWSFQLYSGGVYDEPDCSTSSLDHAVVVVGYGTTDDGIDYWIVRNSWNTDWGIDGYINMSRNKKNQCGIATHALIPVAP
jgi:hypothetical protein